MLEIGSEVGAQMLSNSCDWRLAGAFELDNARRLMADAETQMGQNDGHQRSAKPTVGQSGPPPVG